MPPKVERAPARVRARLEQLRVQIVWGQYSARGTPAGLPAAHMFHELLYSRCLSVGSNTYCRFTCTAQVSVQPATKLDYRAYYSLLHPSHDSHAKAMGLRGSLLDAGNVSSTPLQPLQPLQPRSRSRTSDDMAVVLSA